jgi:putative ATP-dependent endonuclease of the OLD family
VYKHLFETIVDAHEHDDDSADEEPDQDGQAGLLSVVLTTHSPHIASVAPLSSILLLRSEGAAGTKGYSTAAADFTEAEADDLSRYLDVTRAELVFARGVILVEGDAERFLIPAFADELDMLLDEYGVTVCSVAGTNFKPYVKLLCALGIPFAVITDYDEVNKKPRAYNRALKLVRIIDEARGGDDTDALITRIKELETWAESFDECEAFGIFVNDDTLETELFEGDFALAMIETLREHNFSAQRKAMLDAWEADPSTYNRKRLISMVEQMGKGRFAQRLATRVPGFDVPDYVSAAIKHVIGCV